MLVRVINSTRQAKSRFEARDFVTACPSALFVLGFCAEGSRLIHIAKITPEIIPLGELRFWAKGSAYTRYSHVRFVMRRLANRYVPFIAEFRRGGFGVFRRFGSCSWSFRFIRLVTSGFSCLFSFSSLRLVSHISRCEVPRETWLLPSKSQPASPSSILLLVWCQLPVWHNISTWFAKAVRNVRPVSLKWTWLNLARA